jgi:hypothetical protein
MILNPRKWWYNRKLQKAARKTQAERRAFAEGRTSSGTLADGDRAWLFRNRHRLPGGRK